MRKCLFCYSSIEEGFTEFHETCSKKIFGDKIPPEINFSENEIKDLALQLIQSHSTVTGVQAKLSLKLSHEKDPNRTTPKRFTIVGFKGDYILKPASSNYPQLPECEDLTMHLASISKIEVVPHSLIRLKSNQLAYITKRIDRTKSNKVHMEDMCQLSERLSEDKYHGSYEQIAKLILKYSAQTGLDIVNFSELLLFCFLTGNSDMHLKNFSLIHDPNKGILLSPAYDLLATKLVNPVDDEDLTLTLNGARIIASLLHLRKLSPTT